MVDLETALDDCLAQIASGEFTLEECVADYPEHAAELRRLLAAAARLERGRSVRPSASFKSRNRVRLLEYLRGNPRRLPARMLLADGLRLAFGLAVSMLVLLAVGIGAAQASLPGDSLYSWKLASERVWRALTPDALSADLVLTRRRADELKQVAGEVPIESIARQEYRRALTGLNEYTDPASREVIASSLTEQRDELTQTGLTVPELDELITRMEATAVPALPIPATSDISAPTPPGVATETSAPTLPASTPEATTGSLPATPALERTPLATLVITLPAPAPIPVLPLATPGAIVITIIPTALPALPLP